MKILVVIALVMVFGSIYGHSHGSKDSGGPDAAGYYWIDSNELEGPVYNWIDISSTGTNLSLGGDDVSGFINMGFDFSFYGSDYSSVRIYSWGMLSFDGPLNNNYPSELPSENYTVIAPFWAPLDLDERGSVHYYADTVNERFIVQFNDVPESWMSESSYSFQAILNKNGTILFQYKDIIGDKDICAIGIQNSNGSIGLSVSYYDFYVEENLAVLFDSVQDPIGGEIDISVSNLAYGSIAVEEISSNTFTITNNSYTEILHGDIVVPSGFYLCSGSDLEFELNTRSSRVFELDFFPQVAGNYDSYLFINSTDPNNPVDSIAVTASGANPEISTSVPDTLIANVYIDQTLITDFDILNNSNVNLEYSIRYSEPVKAGGSDNSFGYQWKDSDEIGGPEYFWKDISYIGTALGLGDEQISSPISIGFDFNFYGNVYNTARVCDNGFLSFASTGTHPSNARIPNTSQPNNILALFWDDLDPSLGGEIYYYYDSSFERFIVQYTRIQRVVDTGTKTFQMILYEDGTIVYQYRTVSGVLDFCTVGIENSDGTDGIEVVYNAAYLKNDLAIMFVPPKTGRLSVTPLKGFIAGAGSKNIGLSFDSAGLGEGTYYTQLKIGSNDPVNPVKSVTLKINVYDLYAPLDITTSVSSGILTLSWSEVPFASSYRVYSSDDPYGTFTEDLSGSFSGTSWSTSIVNQKKFYRVTALSE